MLKDEELLALAAYLERPDVRVDFEHLMFEQVERSRWLAGELSKGRTENTHAVLAAARVLLSALPLPE